MCEAVKVASEKTPETFMFSRKASGNGGLLKTSGAQRHIKLIFLLLTFVRSCKSRKPAAGSFQPTLVS